MVVVVSDASKWTASGAVPVVLLATSLRDTVPSPVGVVPVEPVGGVGVGVGFVGVGFVGVVGVFGVVGIVGAGVGVTAAVVVLALT